MDEGVIEVK